MAKTFADYAASSVSKPIVLIELTVNGVVKGYAKKDFVPVGSNIFYEGRLSSFFSIGRSRDPLAWGKLQFSGGSFTLINADGYFDSIASTWFIGYYGKPAVIKIGYEELNIADYLTIWTGYIQSFELSPEAVSITVAESRKKLDVDIEKSWIKVPATTVIKEAIILAYPDVTFTSDYFDLTAWSIVEANSPLISYDMTDAKPAIDVIEGVCNSIFGIFFMNPNDKYSLKLVNPDAPAVTTIRKEDVLDVPSITYDPSEVVSSVKVYCDIDTRLSDGKHATIVEDITRKDYVYNTYSIYNVKEFTTYLDGPEAAAAFAIKYLDYCQDVHGIFKVNVTMKYYSLEIGDTVFIELYREGGVPYLSTVKCEIIGKTYNLETFNITFDMRICYDEA